MNRNLIVAALILFALLSGGAAIFASERALRYQEAASALVSEEEVEPQLRRTLRRWLSGLSLGDSDAYAEELRTLEARRREAEGFARAARYGFFAFAAITLLGVVATLARRAQRPLGIGLMLVASTAALGAGLIAPAMAMTASRELPALGSVVLYYESKGILATIVTLLEDDGARLIGIPILCFSVLIPLVKSAVMMAAALSGGRSHRRWMGLIHRFGKWSMADVCVIGWLLAFFAAERQEFLHAELQVGIYFFASYAVLSIAAAQLLETLPANDPPGRLA